MRHNYLILLLILSISIELTNTRVKDCNSKNSSIDKNECNYSENNIKNDRFF